MILNIILKGLSFALFGILRLVSQLRDATLPDAFLSSIATAKTYFLALDTVIPVGSILAVVGFLLVVRFAVFAWGMTNWGLRRLPTQS
jgi:uncharacterized membrane protein